MSSATCLAVCGAPHFRWMERRSLPGTLTSKEASVFGMPAMADFSVLWRTCRGSSLLEFSQDGNILASMGADNIALLWDWKHRKQLDRFPHPEYGGRGIITSPLATTLSPDRSRLIVNAGSAALFDVNKRSFLANFSKPDQAQPAARFSPNGQFVVTACGDALHRFGTARTDY